MTFEYLVDELVEAQQEAENLGLTEVAEEIEGIWIQLALTDPDPLEPGEY